MVSLEAHRLRKHSDYQRVYKEGRKRQAASMTFFVAERENGPAGGPRIGFTTGKVLGKAVDRNRIRRRTKEAVRRNLQLLTVSVDVVLHPRKAVLDMEFKQLEREIVRIFTQVEKNYQPANTTSE